MPEEYGTRSKVEGGERLVRIVLEKNKLPKTVAKATMADSGSHTLIQTAASQVDGFFLN